MAHFKGTLLKDPKNEQLKQCMLMFALGALKVRMDSQIDEEGIKVSVMLPNRLNVI